MLLGNWAVFFKIVKVIDHKGRMGNSSRLETKKTWHAHALSDHWILNQLSRFR